MPTFTDYWKTAANPWAAAGGSLNGQPVQFGSPTAPNTNYVTPGAAGALASQLGANVVQQNTQGTASPGSIAPTPMLGLDFGRGDVQDAGMGIYQAQRGDRPEDIKARYAAGLNNTGWGGPAPSLAPGWDSALWNRQNPVATNTPQDFFSKPQADPGRGQYARNAAAGPSTAPSGVQAGQQQQLMQLLQQLLGLGGGPPAGGSGWGRLFGG